MSKMKLHWMNNNEIACGVDHMYNLFFEETDRFDKVNPKYCCLRCLKKRQKAKEADERHTTNKGLHLEKPNANHL